MGNQHMRDACFGVGEAATMAGITETRLRDWLARNPLCILGTKPKGRIWFSGNEIYVIAIMRDLIGAGYAPHAALHAAFLIAGGPTIRKPQDGAWAITGLDYDGDFIDRRGQWAELAGAGSSCIAIPVSKIYADVEAKAAALYDGGEE